MKKTTISSLISLLLSTPAFAATTMINADDVLVTTNRVEQKLSDVLTSTSVITRQDIERSQAQSMIEILQGEAGIETSRTGGVGSLTTFFMRGQNSISMVIFVDGVRTQVDNIGTVNTVDFPLTQIERIEILRGNSGALYGESAIGGVINIVTRKGKGDPRPYSKISYGTKNTSEISAGYGGELDGYNFNIATSQLKTNGFSSIDTSQKPFANSDDDGATNQSMNASVSKKLTDGFEVGSRVNLIRNKVKYDDDFAYQLSDRNASHLMKTNSDDYIVYGKLSVTDRWVSQLNFTESYLKYENYKDNIKLPIYDGGVHEGIQSQQNWFNTYKIDNHTISFGIDSIQNKYESYGSSYKRDTKGYFVGLNSRIKQLDIQLNKRYDEVKAKSDTANISNYADTELFGLGYYLFDSFKFTATHSTAFRAPASGELFGYGGNVNLAPETHKSNELGLVYSENNDLIRLIHFKTKTDNAIVYSSGSYSNIPSVENEGYELTASTVRDGYNIKGSYVEQDPKNALTNEQLAKRAKNYGSFEIHKRFGEYELGTRVFATGQRVDNSGGAHKLHGYSSWNFYVARKLNDDWTLRAKLENAFDVNYQNTYGYNTPGLGLFVSVYYSPKN